ncbi:PREDICTED: uncharacterized protein LOC105360100 [Ceratosolen solmsi marchali]|uniref:Uncharacterized protein LOC105360100 n=1 Tax=Ceratosolen solmsi marchali TaxID=326594 RepID=A0AAJ6VLZ9_9HYME|nr:PREDICTED: uncharacterized protein LOC105360100 [Ceratosolen solmsi marchali]
MYLIGASIKLCISIILKSKLKIIYILLANTWNMMADAEELKIICGYLEIGRRKVIIYTVFMFSTSILYLIIPISAPLLDYISLHENISRTKIFPIHIEYGISKEKYYYPLLLHFIFGGFPTIMVIVIFDLGFILIVENFAALFALVSYRLSKSLKTAEDIENHVITFSKGDKIAYFHLVNAINLHQQAIGYVNLMEDCYNIPWVIVIFINLLLAGSGFAIFIFKEDQPDELIRYGPIIIAGLIHFYCLFHSGQRIIDYSSQVFDNCYSCKWYNLSTKSIYLVKMMMMRSFRYSTLTAGNLLCLRLNTFTKVKLKI